MSPGLFDEREKKERQTGAPDDEPEFEEGDLPPDQELDFGFSELPPEVQIALLLFIVGGLGAAASKVNWASLLPKTA